ncbi:MAG: HAD family phosphatase [Thomasclavelia sp.]|nr:HAD family phosphatase [Thomasclavelia sp.]
MKLKGVIFDMDGLMIDSERGTFNEIVKFLKGTEYQMDEDTYKKLLGKNTVTSAKLLRELYDDNFPIEKMHKETLTNLDKGFMENGVPIKEGLIELLEYLKENDIQLIVASSSAKERVSKILAKADVLKYFNNTICGNEVTHGKPDPEIFLKACDHLNLSTDEVIVLEDSEAGLLAASNAGIKSICVVDMKYPDPQYAKLPIKIFNSLLEVQSFLKENKLVID